MQSERLLMMRAIQFALAAFLAIIVAMPALAQPTVGGDYAQHFRNLLRQQHERDIAALEQLLQRKDLGEEARRFAEKRLKLLRSEGQLALGYYGEFIIVPSYMDFGEFAFTALRADDGGLDIVRTALLPDEVVFAHVRPGGKVVYKDKRDARKRNEDRRPKTWPFRSDDAQVMLPRKSLAIGEARNSKTAPKPPAGSEGFFYRLANGWLMSPSDPDTPATENVIWGVRREDGGLDLIHAGPVDNGLFASIGPDCVIEPSASGPVLPQAAPIYWEYKTPTGLPAVGPDLLAEFRSKTPPIATVDEYGLSVPGPIIE
jgi:hypothetical protein